MSQQQRCFNNKLSVQQQRIWMRNYQQADNQAQRFEEHEISMRNALYQLSQPTKKAKQAAKTAVEIRREIEKRHELRALDADWFGAEGEL